MSTEYYDRLSPEDKYRLFTGAFHSIRDLYQAWETYPDVDPRSNLMLMMIPCDDYDHGIGHNALRIIKEREGKGPERQLINDVELRNIIENIGLVKSVGNYYEVKDIVYPELIKNGTARLTEINNTGAIEKFVRNFHASPPLIFAEVRDESNYLAFIPDSWTETLMPTLPWVLFEHGDHSDCIYALCGDKISSALSAIDSISITPHEMALLKDAEFISLVQNYDSHDQWYRSFEKQIRGLISVENPFEKFIHIIDKIDTIEFAMDMSEEIIRLSSYILLVPENTDANYRNYMNHLEVLKDTLAESFKSSELFRLMLKTSQESW